MQSRYYNARTARFLSEDTASGKYTDPLSLNKYTYCHNQPVTGYDPDGHFLHILGGALLGGVIGVGATTYDIASQVASGKGLTDIDWKEVGASAAIGLGLGMGAKALSNSKIGQKINSASESVGKKLNSAGEKIGEKLSSGLESLKETGSALATDNGGFASDELMFGKRLTNKLHGDNQTRTIPQQLTREGKTPTIGKMKDLNALGAVSDSEFKVADYLPDKESPKANWKQNSGILRSVMNEGAPIKDTSMFPMKNAGFLGAERNLLRNQGWKYTDGYWHQNH